MRSIDLKYLGLVISVAAAVAFRFFSDFSFATIEHQAALANVAIEQLTPADLRALSVNTLSYQLQRDWFNLTPQGPPEIAGIVLLFALAYVVLRVKLAPVVAGTAVIIAAPFVGIGATIGACAWVLARAA